MKIQVLKSSLLIFLSILCCQQVLAQSQPEAVPTRTNSNSYFDFGAKVGSFLPYGTEGVRELLPMWGLHMGHSVSQTLGIEYDLDMANAKGVTYYLAYVSLRHDFVVGNVLPLFFTLGVDAHYYKRKDSYGEITGSLTEYEWNGSSGWHLGFGTETVIYGDILFRSDFRMGFSPGRQLTVSIAGIYRF